MRLGNQDRKPPAGLPFFALRLKQLSNDLSNIRILISGGADAGLLHALHLSTMDLPLSTQFVFVDRCSTTVELNKYYATKTGLSIETHVSNILDLDCTPVDFIVAHSFINFFQFDLRPALFTAWARLLKPLGCLLVSNKLALNANNEAERDLSTIDDRIEDMKTAASALSLNDNELNELAQSAHHYFHNPLTKHPTLNMPELLHLLQQAQMRFIAIEYYDRSAEAQRGPLSVELGNGVVRAELVARRLN